MNYASLKFSLNKLHPLATNENLKFSKLVQYFLRVCKTKSFADGFYKEIFPGRISLAYFAAQVPKTGYFSCVQSLNIKRDSRQSISLLKWAKYANSFRILNLTEVFLTTEWYWNRMDENIISVPNEDWIKRTFILNRIIFWDTMSMLEKLHISVLSMQYTTSVSFI